MLFIIIVAAILTALFLWRIMTMKVQTFLVLVVVGVAVYYLSQRPSIVAMMDHEDPQTAAPAERRQRKAPTRESAIGDARQSITLPPSALAAGTAEEEGLIQDKSPEYRKTLGNAEAACSSINAEHVTILTNILAANKATGKTRAGSMHAARDWCRQESVLDGDYERCVSALSKKLWGEHTDPAPTPRARPAKSPPAARVASAPESSGNKFHDRLVGMTDALRNQILWEVMQSGEISLKEECDSVARSFFQGFDEDESRNATWNVACRNGRSFGITVYNDSAGSTKVLDCALLKLAGVECFKKF